MSPEYVSVRPTVKGFHGTNGTEQSYRTVWFRAQTNSSVGSMNFFNWLICLREPKMSVDQVTKPQKAQYVKDWTLNSGNILWTTKTNNWKELEWKTADCMNSSVINRNLSISQLKIELIVCWTRTLYVWKLFPEICDRENEPKELAHFGSKLPDSERIIWNKGYVDKEVSSTGTDLVELENIVWIDREVVIIELSPIVLNLDKSIISLWPRYVLQP